jgi:hypothetical protein
MSARCQRTHAHRESSAETELLFLFFLSFLFPTEPFLIMKSPSRIREKHPLHIKCIAMPRPRATATCSSVTAATVMIAVALWLLPLVTTKAAIALVIM